MADPGFRRGGRTEGLSLEHFSFTEAAARLEADSHTDADLSAHIAERDSRNTVTIRPGNHVTVDDSPFDGPTVTITSEASQAAVSGSVEGTATAKFNRALTKVEVSTDGGDTFADATGTDTWTFDVSGLGAGTYNVVARAVDDSGVTGPEATQELVLTA